MISQIVKWILLALVGSWTFRFLMKIDFNKRVYNHVPGHCQLVSGPTQGSEDIELLADGTAIVTSGLAYGNPEMYAKGRGKVFSFNMNEYKRERGQQPPKAKSTRVNIVKGTDSSFDPEWMNPHGITSYVNGAKTIIYIVNHHKHSRDTIESFIWNKETNTLTHERTIRDEHLYSVNDIAAVGVDKFFASNDHYFMNHFARIAEEILMLPLTNLVYYDGKAGKVVDSGLGGANGMAIDHKRGFLYLSLVADEMIRSYKLGKDMSIKHEADISLLTSTDNLYVHKETGDVWSGAHPVLYKTAQYMLKSSDLTGASAPSQVGSKDWIITEPYADDGTHLSASSAAVYHNNLLLIGTVFDKLMLCDMTEYIMD